MSLLPELAGAVIDGAYRYNLWRTLRVTKDPRRLLFIMLNPSTADAQHDDPTLRRCLGFASSWGYDMVEIGNLFAYRATAPEQLRLAADPIGPRNDEYIRLAVERAELVLAAWGARGEFKNRTAEVTRMLACSRQVACLGLTKDGYPRHPLYVSGSATPQTFRF